MQNVQYKVVEISAVTDETIEHVINLWVTQGWAFDQIQFVVRDASRRPSMAFLFFVRPAPSENPDASFEKIVFQDSDEQKPSSIEEKEECD
jgi:hypothetical protein